jgi:hypothetical protein
MDNLTFEKNRDIDTAIDFYTDFEDEDSDSEEFETHDDNDEKTQLD